MSGNLPMGTTHADIDEAFGEPETVVVSGAVDLAVDVEVRADVDDATVREELAAAVRERIEFDDEVIEVAGVRIGEVVES
jgi:hypothetical protein